MYTIVNEKQTSEQANLRFFNSFIHNSVKSVSISLKIGPKETLKDLFTHTRAKTLRQKIEAIFKVKNFTNQILLMTNAKRHQKCLPIILLY